MTRKATYPVRTTEKTLDVMEALDARGEAGVTELADALDMSKSVVHNHLRTLEERGYVLYENEQYRIGLKLFDVAGNTRKRMKLYRVGRPEVERLADETGEVVSLATTERGLCVYLFQAKGDQAVKLEFAYEGMHESMHSTGLGKAILAHLPEERIHEIIDQRGLSRETPQTLTDIDALLADLEQVQERGYATDDEESIEGLRCVGSPIKTGDGQVLGAISVSGPTSRLMGERWEVELPSMVQSATNVIELNAQYS